MTFDVLRAREQTPGCHDLIHFNNAGAALLPQTVLDAMLAHLERETHMGGYEAAVESQAAIQRLYSAAATLLNCRTDEIAFMESATRAWSMAFYAMPWQPEDQILTSMSEYGSNYAAFLHLARKIGITVKVIPNDSYGQISIDALQNALNDRVKLIALTHVPTNSGLVNPAAEVGKIARAAGVLFLLDACQSVGQMPMDVQEIGCDMLSTAGRKYLRGPRGTGMLYVRRSILEQLEPPLLDVQAALWTAADQFEMRQDACRFENWETNYAGKIGLGVAIDYALEWGIDAIWERIRTLAATLRRQMSGIPGVMIQDQGLERCGIVTFTVNGRDLGAIHTALHAYNINIWTSEVSLTRLDMEARGLKGLLRASVHYYNTEAEIVRFCSALEDVIGMSSATPDRNLQHG